MLFSPERDRAAARQVARNATDEESKIKSEHYVLIDSNINRHSFAFSFDTISAKEKASQKENAVFLCRFLKKAPQKLSLIALCEMYTVPDGLGLAMCVR